MKAIVISSGVTFRSEFPDPIGSQFLRHCQKKKDMHNAITLLMENIEGIDCYKQRIEVCEDVALKAILIDYRDQKKHRLILC